MSNLDELRKQIDALDGELLKTLAKRMEIVEALGKYKKAHGMDVRDDERFETLLADRLKRGGTLGLPKELVSALYNAIHEAALEREAGV
jgi:chorismate mutase